MLINSKEYEKYEENVIELLREQVFIEEPEVGTVVQPPKPFYILWREGSQLPPPQAKFTNREEAVKTAESMSHRYGGTFHVMRSVEDVRAEQSVSYHHTTYQSA